MWRALKILKSRSLGETYRVATDNFTVWSWENTDESREDKIQPATVKSKTQKNKHMFVSEP